MGPLFTVGHSTRSADELVEVLSSAAAEALVDVRRFPSSRRHPQHNRPALEETLAAAGIAYRWMGDTLGGRRRSSLAAAESPNGAWQVAAFRHYADAMLGDDFRRAAEDLLAAAARVPTAVMCAERLWWQCHRRLIADWAVARGWSVVHLLDTRRRDTHRLSEWARVEDGVLTYPALL